MKLKVIECGVRQKLSKLIEGNLRFSYDKIQKIIRNKDVKINGKRISKDVEVFEGDVIQVYYNEIKIKSVYHDEDVIVVVKPRGVETVNESGDDLKSILEEQFGVLLFAVHRLDRNTEGLVVFAKNSNAKKSLDEAIKLRLIEKYYLAKVIGVPRQKSADLIAYLKKDSKKSLVYISDESKPGYEKIQTNYKVKSSDDDFSILEVELVTGKTHQIRAHLSHIGYPILGDEKYGSTEVNKKFGKKQQCLCAYKLIFHFRPGDYLSRLNGLSLKLEDEEISFLWLNK